MAGYGRGRSSSSNARLTGASISAAAAGGGSAGPMHSLRDRSTRWGRCFGGLSCFGSQKRGKRVVPASRLPDGGASAGHGSGPQSGGLPSHSASLTLTLTPSLLAPPSSPASVTHSCLPSTAQSPSCFLSISANSPGNPSSTMFATGPYAHETQLVSPPVFSTFTTEPSTAPLTPPPELAHLTTPSSPDVPYAQFLSSAAAAAGAFVSDDLQSTYPIYRGSPSGSFLSPATGTPGGGSSPSLYGQEFPRTQSSRLFAAGSFSSSADSGIFFSASSAQFFLDQAAQLSYTHCHGGRRQSKACKQDVEELEAYRASFGFSADELTAATQSYVELSDQPDDCSSFTMSPFADATADKPCAEPWPTMERTSVFLRTHRPDSASPPFEPRGATLRGQGRCRHYLTDEDEDEEEPHPRMWGTKGGGRGPYLSLSDAEVDYQRSKSWRDHRRIFLHGHC